MARYTQARRSSGQRRNKSDIVKKKVLCDSEATKEIIGNGNCTVLNWGESDVLRNDDVVVKITAIPAYRGNNFIMRNAIGKVNGYLLEISEGSEKITVYFTGDAVFHKDIVKRLPEKVDVLIANMGNVMSKSFGGPITMDTAMLNQYVEKLKPDVLLPVHIDDFSHYEMSSEEMKNGGYNVLSPGDSFELC